jgi:hypothetical protein
MRPSVFTEINSGKTLLVKVSTVERSSNDSFVGENDVARERIAPTKALACHGGGIPEGFGGFVVAIPEE